MVLRPWPRLTCSTRNLTIHRHNVQRRLINDFVVCHQQSVPQNILFQRPISYRLPIGLTPTSFSLNVPNKRNCYFGRDLKRYGSSFPTQEDVNVDLLRESATHEGEGGDDALPMTGREIDQDVDDHLSHLRTKLYPENLDSSGTISRLNEAASIQEVFDIISNCPEDNLLFASQALVTLWDLQKLLFQLTPLFNPEQDFFNKSIFVQCIKEHAVFQTKILRPVLENCKKLEDEALCACLLSLKKMEFRLVEYEPLIEESSHRRDTLSIAALSRLSVCLRTEYLYGYSIMATFSPLILKYVNTMKDDLDIRLVSILLRNSHKTISEAIVNSYISQIGKILESNQQFETVTYCKVFLFLLECGKNAFPLLKEVGTILAKRVPNMDLMELLSLQKFLIGPQQEPYPLIEALLARNLRLIEEDKDRPRLDLLAAVAPYMKGIQQRKKMAQVAKDYMANNNFQHMQNILFSVIRCVRTNDRTLYDEYWNNLLNLIDDKTDIRRVIFCAKNYLNFCHSLLFYYRHLWLESILKKQLYSCLDSYVLNKPSSVIVTPTEFAGVIAFLIAFDQLFVDLKYISKLCDFAPQFKASDLYLIGKGVDCALLNSSSNKRHIPKRNYEIISQICTTLEEECALRLLKNGNATKVNINELTMICRLITTIRKIKGDSPLLDIAIKAFFDATVHDSREVREICNVLFNANYYDPEAFRVTSEFILNNLSATSPETVDRFLNLTYGLGWENEDLDFQKFAEVIEMHWEKLGLGIIQCAISLGFHRQLKPELINKIFTVEFLDQIDEELMSSFGKNQYYPMRLRSALMELNRIACLDVPDARLPWFHEKFCQNIVSQGRPRATYLHKEVFSTLCDIIGGEDAVHQNVCSSKDYYYHIDFVLKFDDSDRPIKRKVKRVLQFSKGSPDDDNNAKRKVAVLILNNSSFTKNVRSLKGGLKLKQRHLEMLGYHVVKIDPHHWNSMYMSENSVKERYLESQIFDQ